MIREEEKGIMRTKHYLYWMSYSDYWKVLAALRLCKLEEKQNILFSLLISQIAAGMDLLKYFEKIYQQNYVVLISLCVVPLLIAYRFLRSKKVQKYSKVLLPMNNFDSIVFYNTGFRNWLFILWRVDGVYRVLARSVPNWR